MKPADTNFLLPMELVLMYYDTNFPESIPLLFGFGTVVKIGLTL